MSVDACGCLIALLFYLSNIDLNLENGCPFPAAKGEMLKNGKLETGGPFVILMSVDMLQICACPAMEICCL